MRFPVCLLPTVEQGPGFPVTMPWLHGVTLGKSLHALPGFPPLPAGRGGLQSPRGSECLPPHTVWLSTKVLQSSPCILAQASDLQSWESNHTKVVLNFSLRQLEVRVVKNFNIGKAKTKPILFSMKTAWKYYLCAIKAVTRELSFCPSNVPHPQRALQRSLTW